MVSNVLSGQPMRAGHAIVVGMFMRVALVARGCRPLCTMSCQTSNTNMTGLPADKGTLFVYEDPLTTPSTFTKTPPISS